MVTTNRFIYLVEYLNTTEKHLFNDLEDVIPMVKKANLVIGKIKLSESANEVKFRRISKERLSNHTNWNTELHLFLKSKNLI